MNKIESLISVLDFGSYSLGLAIYDNIKPKFVLRRKNQF